MFFLFFSLFLPSFGLTEHLKLHLISFIDPLTTFPLFFFHWLLQGRGHFCKLLKRSNSKYLRLSSHVVSVTTSELYQCSAKATPDIYLWMALLCSDKTSPTKTGSWLMGCSLLSSVLGFIISIFYTAQLLVKIIATLHVQFKKKIYTSILPPLTLCVVISFDMLYIISPLYTVTTLT